MRVRPTGTRALAAWRLATRRCCVAWGGSIPPALTMAKLTVKQEQFITEYLLDFNATQAAIRAGYSAKTAYSIASENLRKPDIAAEVKRRLEERVMGREEVLDRLSAFARGSLDDFLDTTYSGLPGFDFAAAKKANKLGLLKKYKVTKTGVEIELHDPMRAQELLGKHYGLFVDRVRNETWQDEIIQLLREGKLTSEDVRKELGDDELAQELFKRVGLPVVTGGES